MFHLSGEKNKDQVYGDTDGSSIASAAAAAVAAANPKVFGNDIPNTATFHYPSHHTQRPFLVVK